MRVRRGLAVTAALVLLAGSAAAGAARLGSAGPATGALARLPGPVPAGAPGGPDGGSGRGPGSAGDPATGPGAEVRARVDAALATQADAVGRDDVAGFLATVDPALHPVMRQRYEALRALRVVEFAARAVDEPTPDAGGADRWQVTIELRFCPGAPGCAPAPVWVPTRWVVTGGTARMVGYEQATGYGPRPWEASELRAVVGARVVVAAPPRYASRLAATLAAAEKAAAQSDRYARWRPKPSRYVVFLAGPAEWSRWYGAKQPAWAAGFTMPISPEYSETVLNADRIDNREIVATLVHEFAHVTTLAGVQRTYTDSWLLVEGLAEYVTHHGRPVGTYPWLPGTRRYVGSGRWPGTAALAAPTQAATVSDATGRYGVAYLAVRRLAERFGEDRLLAFFAAVARDGRDVAVAAPEIFGTGWPDTAADCDRYIRTAAS